MAASLALVGRQYDVNWVVARSFYLVVRPLLGLEVVVEMEGDTGEAGAIAAAKLLAEEKPAVLMMNHQSMLDMLLIGK